MTSNSRMRLLGRGAVYALLLGIVVFNTHRAAERERPADPPAVAFTR